jgi:hypothetical protein
MEDRFWMYDGAGGDQHVTQFVKAVKTHALVEILGM